MQGWLTGGAIAAGVLALVGCSIGGEPRGDGTDPTSATAGGVGERGDGRDASAGRVGSPDIASSQTPCKDLGGVVFGATYSETGEHLLTMGALGVSSLRTADFSVQGSVSDHLGAVLDAALSSDGTLALSLGEDGLVRSWDNPDGTRRAVSAPIEAPTEMALVERAQMVVVAAQDGSLYGLDSGDLDMRWAVEADGSAARSLLASSARDVFAVTRGETLELRDAASGDLLHSVALASQVSALSHDGQRLVAAAGREIVLFEVASELIELRRLAIDGSLRSLALADAEAFAVLGFATRALQARALDDGRMLQSFADGAGAEGLALSPDGRQLAAATAGLRIFDTTTGELLHHQGRPGMVWSHQLRPGTTEVAFRPVGGEIELWDHASGRLLARIAQRPPQGYYGYGPDGGLMVQTGETLQWHSPDDYAAVRSVTLQELGYHDLTSISPDGLRATDVPNVAQHRVRIWDAEAGTVIAQLEPEAASFGGFVWSPDSAAFALVLSDLSADEPASGQASRVALYERDSGELLRELSGHDARIDSIVFSADASELYTADDFGGIKRWDLSTGDEIEQLRAASPPSVDDDSDQADGNMALSPDGRTLAVAGVNWSITDGHTGVVTLIDLDSGAQRQRFFSLNEANLGRVGWSHDGRLVLAGFAGGLRTWCIDRQPEPEPGRPPD